MKRILGALLVLGILAAGLTVCGLWENKILTVTTLEIAADDLPASFDGFRIAQISDLHNARFGKGNAELLDTLEHLQPDIIAFTGDTVDSRSPQTEDALDFLEAAAAIAPCYYVTGNHESRLADREDFLARVESLGVEVLRGEAATLERSGETIQILGVDDYAFFPGRSGKESFLAATQVLTDLDRSGFDIVLYHRPELATELTGLGLDVVLSGHAHGGQFRIPFLGGLIAPDQGFFPDYTEGVHTLGDMALVISRGLGNSGFPFRLNNPPEVVTVVLKADK